MSKSVAGINTYNNTDNFYHSNDLWVSKAYPFKASVALVDGGLVAVEISGSNPTGNLTIAGTTNANGQNVVGILAEPIASTDSDYATGGKMKMVWIPTSPEAEMKFKVGAGTFTAADVGRICQIHTDSKSVAVDTNGLWVEITGYTTSGYGTCKILSGKAVTA